MSQSERAVAFADIKDGVAYFMQAHVLPNEHVFEGLANRCRLPALCAAAACASHDATDDSLSFSLSLSLSLPLHVRIHTCTTITSTHTCIIIIIVVVVITIVTIIFDTCAVT